MRSFLCIGLMENAVVYAISGGMFLAKRSVLLWQNEAVFALSGVQGIFPLQVNFRKFHLGNLRELSLCCHDIGSACYLWQTARREFACCTSLGECPTTHIRALPPVLCKDFKVSGC